MFRTKICWLQLVPLTVRQIHSMQSLQAHAPEMKEIQKKYKGDRAKLNEELMKFYKENHINPAASCLPLLAQFPVFIALYFTLKHGTTCDRHTTCVWNPYEASQPDDLRHSHGQLLTVDFSAARLNDLSLFGQEENDSASQRDNGERFVARIQG